MSWEPIRVMGPHSSGTRLATRLVRASGYTCYHRSLPGSWPTRGMPIVWVSRKYHHTVCSMVRNGHARSVEEAQHFVELAWGQYIAARDDYPHVEIRYEDIVADKRKVIGQVAEALGLKRWVFREEVYDGNKQYDGVDPWDIELNSGDGSGIVVAQVAGRKP